MNGQRINTQITPREQFDGARAAFQAARDAYNAAPTSENRQPLKSAYQAYFFATERMITASPQAVIVRNYAVAAFTAATLRARFAYETVLGGGGCVGSEDKRVPIVREAIAKWQEAEADYVAAGFRAISEDDLKAAVELPGVVSRTAPTPFFDKLFVVREVGEEPVTYADKVPTGGDAPVRAD